MEKEKKGDICNTDQTLCQICHNSCVENAKCLCPTVARQSKAVQHQTFILYRIIEVLGDGAYRLETLEEGAIPRTWNVANPKFYFS